MTHCRPFQSIALRAVALLALLVLPVRAAWLAPRTNAAPATNWTASCWWTATPDTNAVSYRLYADDRQGWNQCWQFYHRSDTNATVSLPLPRRTIWFVIRAYNEAGEGPDSNTVFVPSWDVVDFTGKDMVCFTNLAHPNKIFVGNSFSVTNYPGNSNPPCLYFESTEHGGPTWKRRTFNGS